MNWILTAILAACALNAAEASAACAKASNDAAMRLRVYSPLVATQVGASTDIAIDAQGCVTVRFPSIDKRHGEYRYALGGAEFDSLKREVRAAKLGSVDTAALRRRLQTPAAKHSASTEYLITDADMVELDLMPDLAGTQRTAPISIRWAGIEQDLLNHPASPELQAIEAVRSRLMELSADQRIAGGAEQ